MNLNNLKQFVRDNLLVNHSSLLNIPQICENTMSQYLNSKLHEHIKTSKGRLSFAYYKLKQDYEPYDDCQSHNYPHERLVHSTLWNLADRADPEIDSIINLILENTVYSNFLADIHTKIQESNLPWLLIQAFLEDNKDLNLDLIKEADIGHLFLYSD